MKINTTRFGSVEINHEDIVYFPEGLLGFVDLKQFVFLEDPIDEIFAWLHSVQEPGIAFPILESNFFVDHDIAQLSRSDLLGLNYQNGDSLRFFCIITIPEDPTQMTANLKAPIVINLRYRQGKQCVLQDNHLAIREPIFLKLQTTILAGGWRRWSERNVELSVVTIKKKHALIHNDLGSTQVNSSLSSPEEDSPPEQLLS